MKSKLAKLESISIQIEDEEDPLSWSIKVSERSSIPFPNLPSILITAIVLSYFGFDCEVKDVMRQLSKKCRAYVNNNKMNSFVVKVRYVPR